MYVKFAKHVSKEIQKSVAKITECLKSLKQNALRPDSTTSADYLEQMISAEYHEKKPGYRERIKQLRLKINLRLVLLV